MFLLSRVALIAAALIALQAIILYLLGQPAICECGHVKLWEGTVLSSGNSQHLTDWYSFSHIIHGFLFYLALWFFFPLARRSLGVGGRVSIATCFLLALGIEIGWEIVENTPWLIEHYRQQALAQGYMGDSIINSISDTLMEALGFVLASRLPVWSIIVFGIGLELFVGYSIRDNLTLNVLGFFHQFEFINNWQAGG